MSEDVFNKYVKAGEIGFRAKKFAAKLVKPGARIYDIAEKIESYIKEQGGMPAFPVNISINHVAAHRTAYVEDPEVVPESSVVKVDIGVHVDGYIADTAITFVFNEKYLKLAEIVQKALEKGLRVVRAGTKFSDVGRNIEKVVRKGGYRVVKNLSGHSVDRFIIHAGDVIPNYRDQLSFGKFKVGRAYAIEPFATDGKGWVKEVHGNVQIFSVKKKSIPSDLDDGSIKLLDYILKNFRTLPFCERWLLSIIGDVEELREKITELVSRGILNAYPVLVEVNKGIVAQFEETVVITNDGPYIITNPRLNEEIEAFKKA